MEHLTIPLSILAAACFFGFIAHGWPTIIIHKHYHNDNDKQAKK